VLSVGQKQKPFYKRNCFSPFFARFSSLRVIGKSKSFFSPTTQLWNSDSSKLFSLSLQKSLNREIP
jgi:hypothetical protein